MKKHKTSERNTPLALTIGLLLIISVFAMSSCAKHKAKEESEPTLADSSVTTAEKTEPSDTTSLTDGSSEPSGEVTDTSASTSVSEEPTESFTDSINFNPSDSDSTAPSGAETTPGAGSTDNPSTDPTKAPTKAPKATATPKPKATATPKPKATATPAPKENTPTPVPKENTPTPKPQPKPKGEASSSSAQALLDKINAKRAEAGVAPLSLSDAMNKAARVRAAELAQEYREDHKRPNGKKGTSALIDQGLTYSYAAECIAAGQGSVDEVFNSWMNSEGHRTKMLDPRCKSLGLGYIAPSEDPQGHGTYWCLLLMG